MRDHYLILSDSDKPISAGSRIKIELTNEQLDELQPFENFVQKQVRKGEPVALMAQVEPSGRRMRVIVVDTETVQKIQDVMQAAGYLSEELRIETDAFLQEVADLHSFEAQHD